MDWVEFGKNVLLVILGGGGFKFLEFLIKNHTDQKNRKEDKADQKDERFEDLRKEFKKGLDEREKTGAERFKINSDSIEANTKAIQELIQLNKKQTVKLDAFADTVTKSFDSIISKDSIMGEGVKSVLYDKINIEYNRCLSRCDGGAITSDEEANIEQLYKSYSGLGGNGRGETMYNNAKKMRTVTKEEAEALDARKREKYENSVATTET